MTKRAQIFDYLDYVAPYIPSPLYWLDTNIIVIGANESCLVAIGRVESLDVIVGKSSLDVIIGKSFYEFHPKEVAEELAATTKLVIATGKSIKVEECVIDFATGKERYFETIKSPLFDDDKTVVGVLCTAVEVTDRKEKERLEFDNKEKQARLEERDKFKQVVDQVVHDIRSPIASMQMILPLCDMLPEELRVSLNKSAARMLDIANNLLGKFKPEEDELIDKEVNKRSPTLIAAELLEIITEKKYEYSQLSLDLLVNISQIGYFSFINIDSRAFKRTLSNLINNAVDAFEDRAGEIRVYLDVIENKVQIIIEDNGKGMPDSIKEKILNNISVTSGKADGYGIGFNQIREALENNEGKLDIKSKIGVGTKITLIFPKIEHPEWIAEKIELNNDTLVVILDDDESIHGAWEARFKKASPNINRRHFKIGNDAIEFINNLNSDEKSKIFLLTDYELLRQDLHGLDVINKTGIKKSILVTSHHNNQGVRDAAKLTQTKILPKPLASEIPINILDNIAINKEPEVSTELRKVDLVIIDDDKEFVNSFVRFITYDEKKIDKYYTAQDFQNNLAQYPKDTHFLIDNTFKGEEITGVELSVKLHELGFTRLHLFSGRDFRGDRSIPGYLDLILKTDLDTVKRLLDI